MTTYTIGNDIDGYTTLPIGYMNKIITNELVNMNDNNEFYNYYMSIIAYNKKCVEIGFFISPFVFNDEMNYFKYDYKQSIYEYNKNKDLNDSAEIKKYETLKKINNYVWKCIEVSNKYKHTYCVACKTKLLKASWNRHLKTIYHNKNVKKE